MRPTLPYASGIVLAALPALPVRAQDGDDVLRLGGRTVLELTGAEPHMTGVGCYRSFDLVPGASGPVTIELSSFDFDTFLRVSGPDGSTLAEDDNGGVETNSRLVLELEERALYTLHAATKDRRFGECELSVTAGAREPLAGAVLLDLAIHYRTEAGERAVARDDVTGAAWHRLQLGEHYLVRERFAEAVAALEEARALYARARAELQWEGAAEWEVRALHGVGRAAFARGDYVHAEAAFEEVLFHYQEVGDQSGMVSALLNLGLVDERRGGDALERYRDALSLAESLDDPALLQRALGCYGRALVVQQRWDEADAVLERRLELAEAALADAQETEDPERLRSARSLLAQALGDLGQRCQIQGGGERLRCALDLFDRQRELCKQVGERLNECTALGNMGTVYEELNLVAEGRERHQKVLAIAEQVGWIDGQLTALQSLGACSRQLNQWKEALDHYRRMEALAKEHGRAEAGHEARVGLGVSLRNLGDNEQGGKILRKCLAEETRGSQRADLLRQIAIVELNLDRPEEAIALLEQAIEVRGGEADVRILCDLGRACLLLDDLDRAEVHYRAAQGLDAGHLGTLWGLARVCELRGELAEAVGLQRRRLASAQEIGREGAAVDAHQCLGGLFFKLGSHSVAADHHSYALDLCRKRGDDYGVAWSLNGLGNCAADLGDDVGAESHYRAALKVARGGNLSSWEVTLLGNLAVLHHKRGEADEAVQLAREALEKVRVLENGRQEPWLLGNLSEHLLLLGEDEPARDAAQKCLDHPDREGPFDVLGALKTLASLAITEGHLEEAREHVERWESYSSGMQREARAVGEGSGISNPEFEAAWARVAQDLTLAELRQAEEAEDAEAARAAVAAGFRDAADRKDAELLAGVVQHRLGKRNRETIRHQRLQRELRAQVEAQERELMRLQREGTGADTQTAREGLAEIRAEKDQVDRLLRAIAPRNAGLEARRVTPEDVQEKLLDDDTVLIEYAEATERLVAYVITREDAALLDLGPREALARDVGAFTTLLRLDAPGQLADVARQGRALFDALLAPALARAGHAERLVVVPTAPLAGLPFEALVIEAPESLAGAGFGDLEHVIDRYEVAHGPSTPVLVDLGGAGPRAGPGRVLVLADPTYGEEQPILAAEDAPQTDEPAGGLFSLVPRELPESGTFARLQKTRAEAFALADLLVDAEGDAAAELQALRRARSGSFTSAALDLHLGDAANRARLDGNLRRYAVLHLAAHGHVDRLLPQRSGLALAFPGDDLGAGYFSVADALELDLDADLTVLSACDSGRGPVRNGSVESLARAFLYSGSRAVVASLWQVADDAAAETMADFYHLFADRPACEALREAKRALRRGTTARGVAPGRAGSDGPFAHPAAWAPFVYVGLPR